MTRENVLEILICDGFSSLCEGMLDVLGCYITARIGIKILEESPQPVIGKNPFYFNGSR